MAFERGTRSIIGADWELLDERLPVEIVIHSVQAFEFKEYKNNILRKLYALKTKYKKVAVFTKIDGRKVDIIKDPVMEGHLTVIIHREPKNVRLTLAEAEKIIGKVEKLLEVSIEWGKPFPRGSCT